MFVGEPPTTSISVGFNLLQSVENFQYLGSYISNQSDIEVDIWARLGKAALVFQRLNRIWSSHSINSTIKFRQYASIVLSTALHACETWKSTARIRNTLDVFHRRFIWKILELSWQDHVTNEELMRRSGMQALSEIVQTQRLRLAGHILRLPDVRPGRVAMTWIPESGWRTSSRPQMTWRTSFKEDLHRMNLTWHDARGAANDRHRWKNLVAQSLGQGELSLSLSKCTCYIYLHLLYILRQQWVCEYFLIMVNYLYTVFEKSVAYLIFYNLKKSEPIIIIFGVQHPDNQS